MATSKDRRPGASARQKSAAFRAAERARARRRRVIRWTATVGGAAVIVAAIVIGTVLGTSHSAKAHAPATTPASTDTSTATLTGPPGPEGIVLEQAPLLAPASTAATGQTTDGIQCNTSEQVVYHIHTHLTIYVDGTLRAVPAGIGTVQPVPQQTQNGTFVQASQCYYWLHTHAQDGIIHIEAPSQSTYTLGQFFAIWRQPLTTSQVGPARGAVIAYVNGVRYTGDPGAIPLDSHEDVQLDVGSPTVAPHKVDWSHAQL